MPDSSLDLLFERVRQIEGLVMGCLVDAATGMVLGSVQDEGESNVQVAAAGAVDVAHVVSLMSGELAAEGGLEDVIITLRGRYHLIRRFSPAPKLNFLLLVVLDRAGTNLAMALRQLRDLDVSFVRGGAPERRPSTV
ncbi:hypothetical protein [Actinocorallia populi]|uniref:hypothetical protein n=1 Tax=Actinocorallia populi TaxID=2079200 RepID=UPI000D08A757|nr:hypothetical protein [Actinocorallia populi]